MSLFNKSLSRIVLLYNMYKRTHQPIIIIILLQLSLQWVKFSIIYRYKQHINKYNII